MKNRKEEVLVLILGVIFSLFLFEIGLRAVFFGYNNLSGGLIFDKDIKRIRNDGTYKILCIGNSHTAEIIGEISYPEHLQDMLSEEYTEENISVLNAGEANLNSRQLLEKLEVYMERSPPDLVVLRTGSPNIWNYQGYYDYLEEKSNLSLTDEVVRRIRGFFRESYIYRFLSTFKGYQRGINDYYSVKKDPLEYKRVLDYFSVSLEEYERLENYREAMEWYKSLKCEPTRFGKQRIDQSNSLSFKKTFKRAVNIFSDVPSNYRILGDIYYCEGRKLESVEWYIKGVREAKSHENVNKNYYRIRNLLKYGEEKVKKRLLSFLEDIKTEDPKKYARLNIKSSSKYDWLESDLYEAVDLIQSQNSSLIMINYHPIYPQNISVSHRKVNKILEDAAKRNNVSFIDIYEVFRQKYQKVKHPEAYYHKIGGLLDIHLNTQGNKIVAENIFKEIKSKGVIKKGKSENKVIGVKNG